MFSYKFLVPFLSVTVMASAVAKGGGASAPAAAITIVLVHGAFADSTSWSGVVPRLQAHGLRVISVANPLRTLRGDADYLGQLVDSVPGPVVLVGHSYGGAVITNAAAGRKNVKALVYVAAFIPDVGETALALAGKFPGGTLGDALDTLVMLADGGKDLYIQQAKFHQQFAADVPRDAAALMAATQRPIAEAALTQASGAPAWKDVPSWSIYGTADKNIPPAAMRFMSERAGARKVVEVKDASHVVMVSHPDKVAALIVEAAR
jgi:pimeloyl-ACP methyl ester carboxylesterase